MYFSARFVNEKLPLQKTKVYRKDTAGVKTDDRAVQNWHQIRILGRFLNYISWYYDFIAYFLPMCERLSDFKHKIHVNLQQGYTLILSYPQRVPVFLFTEGVEERHQRCIKPTMEPYKTDTKTGSSIVLLTIWRKRTTLILRLSRKDGIERYPTLKRRVLAARESWLSRKTVPKGTRCQRGESLPPRFLGPVGKAVPKGTRR